MRRNVYILSGLGADKRTFQNVNLSEFKPIFIDWIKPENDERIETYSKRISEIINTPNAIIIGLSFGGIIGVEITKHIEVDKLILISSVQTKSEIPIYYKIIGMLRINRLLPSRFFKYSNFFTYWFFGISTDSDKNILRQILKETDKDFLIWALDKVLHWSNTWKGENIIHIHGSKDRILPIHNVTPNYMIKGGGHLMILNKSNEIEMILKREIKNGA